MKISHLCGFQNHVGPSNEKLAKAAENMDSVGTITEFQSVVMSTCCRQCPQTIQCAEKYALCKFISSLSFL